MSREPRTKAAGSSKIAAGATAPSDRAGPRYLLRLYMTGTRSRSLRALENIKRICEENLQGCYDLEVVDLYQQPALAAPEQIIASPTLVKRYPTPERRVVGDMSDTQRVLSGLDLDAATNVPFELLESTETPAIEQGDCNAGPR